MTLSQAKQIAIATARQFKQPMYVVERNGRYFAADRGDMQRQFAGVEPVAAITKFARAA